MCLVEPKTQLFKKSCVLDSGKTEVQNALHLWTSEVHKWKRASARFGICYRWQEFYQNSPHLTDTHRHSQTHTISFLSHWPSSLCSSRRTPPSHASQPRSALCSALRSALRGKLLPLLLLSFFRLLQHDFDFFFFLISV